MQDDNGIQRNQPDVTYPIDIMGFGGRQNGINLKLIPEPYKNIASHFKRAEIVFKGDKITCLREYLTEHLVRRSIIGIIRVVEFIVT